MAQLTEKNLHTSFKKKITDFIKSLVLASLSVPKDLTIVGSPPPKKIFYEDNGKTNLHQPTVNLITKTLLGRRFATLDKDAALRKIHVTRNC